MELEELKVHADLVGMTDYYFPEAPPVPRGSIMHRIKGQDELATARLEWILTEFEAQWRKPNE